MGRTLWLALILVGAFSHELRATSACRPHITVLPAEKIRPEYSDDPVVNIQAETIVPLLWLRSKGNEAPADRIATLATLTQFVSASKDPRIPTIDELKNNSTNQELIDTLIFEVLTWRASEIEPRHPLRIQIESRRKYQNLPATEKDVDRVFHSQIRSIRQYLNSRRSK